MDADNALKTLCDGNKRFVDNTLLYPNRCKDFRNSLVEGQKPFAAVLSCSDSRVPVEMIFDAGFGDIFVIRTAGHVLSKEVMGSIEYAVKKLGVQLVMILGHDNCGAVDAAVNSYKTHNYNELSENLKALVNHIYPAIENLNDFNCAVRANVEYQIKDLLEKDKYIAENAKVVGAIYSLETGQVEIL